MITHRDVVKEYENQNGLIVAQKINASTQSESSRVKFFRKENCKYHIQMYDSSKNLKELYELKVKEKMLQFKIF